MNESSNRGPGPGPVRDRGDGRRNSGSVGCWLWVGGLVFGLATLGACSSSGQGGATDGTGGGRAGTGGAPASSGGNRGTGGDAGSGGIRGTGGNGAGTGGLSATGGGGIPASGTGGAGLSGSAGGNGGRGPSGASGGSGSGTMGGARGNIDGGGDLSSPADAAGSDGPRDASSGETPTTPSPAYNPCPPAGTVCTIMPFGDSITDGFTVRGGYRIQFFHRAHLDGKQFTFVGSNPNGPMNVDMVPFPRFHEGHSAFTINNEPSVPRDGIAPLVPMVMPRFRPDIVLLMIGTNDVDNSLDLPNLPNRLGALIDSIVAADAHTLLVVAQITPTMQDPLNARIRTYNAAIPAVVQRRADAGKHVLLLDMYTALAQDPAFKTKFLADRLHPNDAGYAQMGDVWYALVRDLLH